MLPIEHKKNGYCIHLVNKINNHAILFILSLHDTNINVAI